jgi:hypothetical protein
MKTIRTIFIAATLALLSPAVEAQEVRYTYDAAGNRTGYEIEQRVQDTVIIQKVTEPVLPAQQQEVFTVRVYPNPVSGILHVELPDLPPAQTGTLEIYSSMGNPAIQPKPLGSTQSIDLSGVSPGVYVVRVTAGKHTAVTKIIKL